MTNEELIKLGKEEILKNHKQLYISRYTAVFGKAPSCASCTFSKDFRAFKEKIRKKETNLKIDTMATGYKLSPRFNSTILSYQTDKGIKRIYGRNMTDEFAEAFLTNGSKKQIAERKKMFVEIPEKKEAAKVEKTKVDEVKEGDKIDINGVDINGVKEEGSYEVKSTDNAPKKSAPKNRKKRKGNK